MSRKWKHKTFTKQHFVNKYNADSSSRQQPHALSTTISRLIKSSASLQPSTFNLGGILIFPHFFRATLFPWALTSTRRITISKRQTCWRFKQVSISFLFFIFIFLPSMSLTCLCTGKLIDIWKMFYILFSNPPSLLGVKLSDVN